jgi:hypothetical protein
MRNFLIICLAFGMAAAAFAVDYGLVLGGEGEYDQVMEPAEFSLTGTAVPWVSAVLNEKIDGYLSGKLTFQYLQKQESPSPFFEVERFEIHFRPAPPLYVSLGRQSFQDSAGMIASGLFDGLSAALSLEAGRFSLGAFYTGLLYKETAEILMTGSDIQQYEKPLNAPNLAGYFASRRVLLSLAGEFPGLTPRTSLVIQALAQLDVNGALDTLHTEYLEARFSAELFDGLHVNLGGLGELAQGTGGNQWSLAAFAGADWEVSGAAPDLLSAQILWASGKQDSRRAFSPVSSISPGQISGFKLEALMSAGLSYRVRPRQVFSAEAGAVYLIRTDRETLADAGLDSDSVSPLLGPEVYGSLVWAPDSAVRLSAGGGAFFPQRGGAFRTGAPVRWKAKLGLIVSF